MMSLTAQAAVQNDTRLNSTKRPSSGLSQPLPPQTPPGFLGEGDRPEGGRGVLGRTRLSNARPKPAITSTRLKPSSSPNRVKTNSNGVTRPTPRHAESVSASLLKTPSRPPPLRSNHCSIDGPARAARAPPPAG